MARTLPAGFVARLATATLVALLSLLVSSVARADRAVSLPALDGVKSPLQVRIVGYDGGTNGEMRVEVTNPSKKAAAFVARGLFFVPEGDPEQAPQRLGATGPFHAPGDDKLVERLEVEPGTTVEVRLEVFCIDSHRPSPTADSRFGLGKKRLPKNLRTEIEAKTQATLARHKGAMPAPAKAAIQSDVWSARDRKWVALEGERKVEKPAASPASPVHKHPMRPRPMPAETVVY